MAPSPKTTQTVKGRNVRSSKTQLRPKPSCKPISESITTVPSYARTRSAQSGKPHATMCFGFASISEAPRRMLAENAEKRCHMFVDLQTRTDLPCSLIVSLCPPRHCRQMHQCHPHRQLRKASSAVWPAVCQIHGQGRAHVSHTYKISRQASSARSRLRKTHGASASERPSVVEKRQKNKKESGTKRNINSK